MKFLRQILFLTALVAVAACSNRANPAQPGATDVVLVFQDAPSQTTAHVIGKSISQMLFESVSAIDTAGTLIQFSPREAGNDTLTLSTYAGHCEVMLLYQCLERDFYLLKAGDTVLVNYDNKFRPHLTSKISENNTRLYNLPYADARVIHANGYSAAGILASDTFRSWHRYYTDPASQKRFPELREQFDPVHVDLDSLGIVYSEYLEDFRGVVDSLASAGETVYADYYRRTILGEGDYSAVDVIRNDSLMHYIRNYTKATGYPKGERSPEKFDFMLSDTIATPLAKKMILKDLVNRIRKSDFWTRYPDSLIEKYENLYVSVTGDTAVAHEIISNPAVPDNGGYSYDLVLEDADGARTTLEELVKENGGNVIFMDFWASWCAPCRGEMPKAKEIRKAFADSNVSFIYISEDTDASAWKKAMKDCDTYSYGGRNYRLLNAESSVFMKQIKARFIPQFVMIGKDGKVLDIDAPRPSSGELETALKSAL